MNRFLTWADDRLNPIVVKELRQAVQGRFVAAVLHLLLTMQVMMITVYLLSSDIETITMTSLRGRGSDIFGWIFGFLLFVTIVVLPLYVAIRLSIERTGDALSLLFISTLSPRRIISGIFLANLVLVLLLFSACLPFIFFTYFLRGVDLPSILVILIEGLVVASVCLQIAILAAFLPTSRFIRILLGLAVLVALPSSFMGAIQVFMFQLSSGIGSRLGTSEFWYGAGLFLGFAGFLLVAAYLFAVAVISPPTANRAPPLRLFLSFSWLGSGLVAFHQVYYLGHRELLLAWLMIWMFIAVGSLAVAISAPDQMNARVARSVPRPLLRRVLAFFLWSGSANGLAWSISLLLLTMSTTIVLSELLVGRSINDLEEILGFAGYCVAYALTALFVHRRFFARRLPVSRTWFVAVVLMVAGVLLPLVVGFLLSPDEFARDRDNWKWLILNPFSAFDSPAHHTTIPFGLSWAAFTLVLACAWGWRQVRAFVPIA